MIAIEVAHFVEQAVAVLLFGAVIVEGNLDTHTSGRAPIELTELAICVVELDGDFGELAFKDGLVELVKPSLHLRDSRFHILVVFGVTLSFIAKAVPKPIAGLTQGTGAL